MKTKRKKFYNSILKRYFNKYDFSSYNFKSIQKCTIPSSYRRGTKSSNTLNSAVAEGFCNRFDFSVGKTAVKEYCIIESPDSTDGDSGSDK
jgi:hypothetical protein